MNSRILVVDDDPDVLLFLSFALRREGYQVDTAPGGEAALHRVHQVRPDAVVLDVTMPGIDGPEVARRLRAQPDTAGIPILMLTALSPMSRRTHDLQAGGALCLTKPISPAALAQALRTIDPQP